MNRDELILSCEETVKKGLNDFLRMKDNATGELKELGNIFKQLK